jgi:preprotein translocase subunit SecD
MVVIAALVAVSACALPTLPVNRTPDWRGGVELTIQARPADASKQLAERDRDLVKQVIENRIKGLGVAGVVKVEGQDRILVQLPKTVDLAQAERVLGGTAQLNFREQLEGNEQRLPIELAFLRELQVKQQQLRDGGNAKAIANNQAAIQASAAAIVKLFKDTDLTGKNLTDAFPDHSTGTIWSIGVRFDPAGADKFAALTQRLAGTKRAIGIFLDDALISAPIVGGEFKPKGIEGGSATITGTFDAQSANELAVQLKSGALPVPIQIVGKRPI